MNLKKILFSLENQTNRIFSSIKITKENADYDECVCRLARIEGGMIYEQLYKI